MPSSQKDNEKHSKCRLLGKSFSMGIYQFTTDFVIFRLMRNQIPTKRVEETKYYG